MKRIALVFAALIVPAASLHRGQVVEEIIARVNNQIITRSEYARSKDQLRDEVKQQDADRRRQGYADRKKMFSAI